METKKFKCKDEVIYRRNFEEDEWTYGIFSHYHDKFRCAVVNGVSIILDRWDILPYEGNEELVGTTDEVEEGVRLEKEERIICNSDVNLLMQGVGFLTTFSYIHGDTFYTGKSRFVEADYNYAIKFSDFNPSNMEETKKHILAVKNGRIVKYHGKN